MPSRLDFWTFSSGAPGFLCNLVRKPAQNMDKILVVMVLSAPIGRFKKALRPFSAEPPKANSDACLWGDLVRILVVHPAVTLTFGL